MNNKQVYSIVGLDELISCYFIMSYGVCYLKCFCLFLFYLPVLETKFQCKRHCRLPLLPGQPSLFSHPQTSSTLDCSASRPRTTMVRTSRRDVPHHATFTCTGQWQLLAASFASLSTIQCNLTVGQIRNKLTSLSASRGSKSWNIGSGGSRGGCSGKAGDGGYVEGQLFTPTNGIASLHQKMTKHSSIMTR